MNWHFCKMHGAGNDFILLDLRDGRVPPAPDECRLLADRHLGVGCDQILTIEPPRTSAALAAYRIFNADGSASGQCGNGARCVAAWLVRAGAAAAGSRFVLDSPAGTHTVHDLYDGQVQVSMGHPVFTPEHLPLHGFTAAQTSYHFVFEEEPRSIDAGALSLGNPHMVLEVPRLAEAAVERWGRMFQRSVYFPESVNVGFAEVINARHIRLVVFERGVGETLACGSGACAAVVSLIRRGRIGRDVAVEMPGGTVQVAWLDDHAEIIMQGPAMFVFEGELIP